RIANAGEQARLVERLFDKVEGADLDGGDSHIDVAMAGNQYDRRCKAFRLELLHQIEPGEARHADIGDDAVEAIAAADRREKVLRLREARHRDALKVEIEPQRVEHGLVIVDQRDMECRAHEPDAFAMGSVKRTAPPDLPSSSHSLPPCASTIDRHNESPIPRPSALVDESGRNALSITRGGNPGPESATWTSTKSISAGLTEIETMPLDLPLTAIASTALRSRLMRTCSICNRSTMTFGKSAGISVRTLTCARSRSGWHSSTVSRTIRSKLHGSRLLRSSRTKARKWRTTSAARSICATAFFDVLATVAASAFPESMASFSSRA